MIIIAFLVLPIVYLLFMSENEGCGCLILLVIICAVCYGSPAIIGSAG